MLAAAPPAAVLLRREGKESGERELQGRKVSVHMLVGMEDVTQLQLKQEEWP